MTAGWSCPECGLVLAPHVTEHRCDPPSAGSGGVTVTPWAPSSGSGGISCSSDTGGRVVSINAAGRVASTQELVEALNREQLARSANNYRGTWGLPGRTA